MLLNSITVWANTMIKQEVEDFLIDMGIPLNEQNNEYKLEIAYRIGYEDAIRNYAIWKDGVQSIGAMNRDIKCLLAEFQNQSVPVRY